MLINIIKSILTCLMLLSALYAMPSMAREQQPDIAWQKINANATVIDVRTPEEFAAGHIKGAINIPFDSIVPQLAKLNLSKNTELVLYCRSGRRSSIAQASLIEQGYNNTYDAGGLNTLMSAR
ncbi:MULTISPECIES: rhodanese-like domain-containing protein [Shewanella]|uniref:Rhodanese-like domain-containing protein n=1 Tax=Shewanella metallivivens TaxID=2872342 RepID=A0ABT5TKY6_9GAMM|nr:rhodanese-like domain-containing protein [Shewanella metallivivens]